MRILLGQLAPKLGGVEENLRRIDSVLAGRRAELAVFPELFLSGYRVGDAVHGLALRPGDDRFRRLAEIAREHGAHIAVGAPLALPERPGETANAALLVSPEGEVRWQIKRYLPTYGPFEEGALYSPSDTSRALPLGRHKVGLAICYDTFFPELFRRLALDGGELLVILSASPVTSRRLFDRILPARAIENATPVVYVNRVGVEEGLVFGGGSAAFDVRGEALPLTSSPLPGGEAEELLLEGEVDLGEAGRWRPFRPVLRDISSRPADG